MFGFLIYHPGLVQQGHLWQQYQRTLTQPIPRINNQQIKERTGTKIGPTNLIASLSEDV
jgi:hypothetical protein